MRRLDRHITSRPFIDSIIRRCRVCRLALCSDGQPYIVPLCFGYDGHALYFHAATEGRKLEILRKNNQVCFEFDIPGELTGEGGTCTMKYESVIGAGAAEIITDEELKKEALRHIVRQYAREDMDFPDPVLERTLVIRVEIEDINGKANQ